MEPLGIGILVACIVLILVCFVPVVLQCLHRLEDDT
jgi:hypothetical protein